MTRQCFAERVYSDKHAILNTELLHHAGSPRTKDTRRVCLIHNEIPIAAGKKFINNLNKFLDRRHVTIHTVYGFDDNEHVPCTTLNLTVGFNLSQENISQSRGRAMSKHLPFPGPRQPHALVDAGVDELIVQDEIARLRDAGEDAYIGIEAGIEQKGRRRLVKGGNEAFEFLGICRVAVQ